MQALRRWLKSRLGLGWSWNPALDWVGVRWRQITCGILCCIISHWVSYYTSCLWHGGRQVHFGGKFPLSPLVNPPLVGIKRDASPAINDLIDAHWPDSGKVGRLVCLLSVFFSILFFIFSNCTRRDGCSCWSSSCSEMAIRTAARVYDINRSTLKYTLTGNHKWEFKSRLI